MINGVWERITWNIMQNCSLEIRPRLDLGKTMSAIFLRVWVSIYLDNKSQGLGKLNLSIKYFVQAVIFVNMFITVPM